MVTPGVPQGSVLGTLTFLLFVNDIADNVVTVLSTFLLMIQKIFSTSVSLGDDTNSLFVWG